MMTKAKGRSALILATGLWVCFAGPSQAAAGTDDTAASSKSESAAGAPIALNKYTKQASKRYAHRKSSKEKEAVKSSTTKKAAAADAAAAEDGGSSSAIPPAVANANAQLATADTPAGNAKAMSERATNILQNGPDNPADAQPAAETQVVAADQLNDLDRALQESKAPPSTTPAPILAMASAEPPVVASSSESSSWDQTSLIGKIFIAFGGLLTLASAARMFMA